MAISDISKIVARVSWIIGSRDTLFDDTIADDRFIQEEIRRSVLESEAEIVRAVCESYHPMRSAFLNWSADLASGDTLPVHIGPVEAVQIKPYTAGSYSPAESVSRDDVKQWRANVNNIFDTVAHDQSGSTLAGYYNITNETITFTGSAAQVKICSYSPDYATPALQIDDQFDGALVACSIPKLNKLGVPQALMESYGAVYQNIMQGIRQGMSVAPDIANAQANE